MSALSAVRCRLPVLGLLLGLLLLRPPAAHAAGNAVAEAEQLLENWQLEDAKAEAERLLAAEPANPEVLLLAARVQHARGEHLSALSLARAAEAGGAKGASALLPLIESSAAYATQFQTIETKHFRIRYVNKDEIVAGYAAPVLEAAYQRIGTALGLLAAERGEKIAVEIYPEVRGLAGATGLTIHEIEASGTIAVCKFHRLMITSPLATADGYGWADTLAHEFTHLIISKKSHNTIPIWLHEGIAKYFESLWRGEAGAALQPYSEKLLANALRTGKFISFQQMHPSMAKLPTQEDAALAFAEVFTTMEMLVHEHGVGSVGEVLELCAHGVEVEVALRRIYGSNLAGIEAAWHRYLLHRPFREVAGAKPRLIRLAAGEGQEQGTRALEEIQDRETRDHARLGELLQLRAHPQAAVIEYEKAYAKGGVAYATLAYRLARAYAGARREKDAIALLDRALAAHPDDNDCHLLAGRLRLAAGEVDAARAHFEAVRLQNPFNPEIHEALRALYEAKGDKENAAKEAHLLELARHPRPSRVYELPAPHAGVSGLNIVPRRFGDVRVDGELVAAPFWDLRVAAGAHLLAYSKPDGSAAEQKATLRDGEQQTVVLP
jgi:tetratricopeptide (TPR) repeat protein